MCLALGTLGCRSRLAVKTKGSTALQEKDQASGTQTLIPDGFSSARTHFQSRSQITVGISAKVVEPGERFSLVNTTTDTVLVDQQTLELADAGLAAQPSYKVLVQFYPLDRETLGRFAYGLNTLHVTSESGRAAEQMLTLQDFSVRAPALAYFDNGQQRQDEAGISFQGEVGTITNSVVTDGQRFLVTGMLTTLNQ